MNTNIIILLLILIPILYIIFISYHTEKSTINSNNHTNIKTIPCGVLSSSTIKKCDKDSNICQSCQCSSDPNIIQNCMTCTTVNEQNKYIVTLSKEDCKDPFEFNDETQKCQLKDGKYCLPDKMVDIYCNPYTSDKLLTLENNLYKWKCVCKDPFKFDGPTCSNIKICGLRDGTSNPNPYNKRALIRSGTSSKPDYWDYKKSVWDPIKDTECICGEKETYFSNTKRCLPNTCGKGGTTDPTDNRSCKDCADGYISCDRINISTEVPDKGICFMPSCIPDPCSGGGDNKNGSLSPNTDVCMCNDGYFDLPDPNSVIGHSCQNPCETHNPCGKGDEQRGDCYVWTKENDNIVWTIDCLDSSNPPCKEYSFININKNINININKYKYLTSDFKLQDEGNNSTKFSIVTETGVEATLKKDQSFYIKTGPNYLDFKNKTTKPSSDKTLLITFLQDSDCNPYANEFKLQNPDESYISGNIGADSKIDTNAQSWKGTARCTNCKSGNIQDSQGYCNQTDPGSCGCEYKFPGCDLKGDHCNTGYRASCNLNLFGARCDCKCIRG